MSSEADAMMDESTGEVVKSFIPSSGCELHLYSIESR